MANNKDYQIAIKIAGEIEKSFSNAVKMSKSELNAIAKEATSSSTTLSEDFNKGFQLTESGFRNLESVAKTTLKATAVAAGAAVTAIAAIATQAVNTGVEFESAFAGVKKTTDATANEYEALREEIIATTREIPATGEEISEVAEAAGQLGIAKGYLLDFSEVMINLGESTNLLATEAASELAKFANITGMSANDYERLGSTIVDLGNNFATTEADIVSMATRLAATGELTGLSESEMLALSTAMSSVGIEAEAGGTAMSKLLKEMQIATELGGNSLNQFATVANMSSEEFTKAFREDATKALSKFIDGLDDTERLGKSATVILDDMELSEVRLSNTILSLANANNVMTGAINTANKAWEENIALEVEASKRYETTESKVQLAKNAFEELQLSLYDSGLQGMYGSGIAYVTDFLHDLTDEAERSGALNNFFENLSEDIPTVLREFDQFKDSFMEFADPFIDVGTWLWNHPELIESTLLGIGAAIATYKLESGIHSVAKGFAGLSAILTNPFAAGISAVALAIGGAAGISYYISKANKEIGKTNLAEHFGDIALSIDELDDVASQIIQTESLSRLNEALGAFDDVESLSTSIGQTVKELNKANWKVSIGMELSESEKALYQANIESFIAQSQEAILQQQYATSLNLNIMTDNDAQGESIRAGFTAFYENYATDVAELGTKLQNAVNTAFEDGLLTIDEVKEINELQAQISRITEKLTSSQFEAKIDVLDLKYSGGNLSSDSFINLQSELQKQVDDAISGYDESLQLSIASAKIRSEEDPSYSLQQYETDIEEFKQNYIEQLTEIELKSQNFMVDTIKENYPNLEAALDELQGLINDDMQDMQFLSGADLAQAYKKLQGEIEQILSKEDSKGLDQVMEYLLPSQQNLQDLTAIYNEFGLAIPNELDAVLTDQQMLSALSGDIDNIRFIMGNALAEEKGISPYTEAYANELIDQLNESVNSKYGDLLGIGRRVGNIVTSGVGSKSEFIPISGDIPGYANGGIIQHPTLATFAEEVPEAAIPLDGSKRSVNLWEQAGAALGVERFTDIEANISGNTESKPQISYNPVMNFYGTAPSEDDLTAANDEAQEKFNRMLENYFREAGRVKFG